MARPLTRSGPGCGKDTSLSFVIRLAGAGERPEMPPEKKRSIGPVSMWLQGRPVTGNESFASLRAGSIPSRRLLPGSYRLAGKRGTPPQVPGHRKRLIGATSWAFELRSSCAPAGAWLRVIPEEGGDHFCRPPAGLFPRRGFPQRRPWPRLWSGNGWRFPNQEGAQPGECLRPVAHAVLHRLAQLGK